MGSNLKELLAEQLFNTVAEQLIAKIKSGQYTHQDMKNAIEFLKNNNITCDLMTPKVVEELLEEMDLPFTNDNEYKMTEAN